MKYLNLVFIVSLLPLHIKAQNTSLLAPPAQSQKELPEVDEINKASGTTNTPVFQSSAPVFQSSTPEVRAEDVPPPNLPNTLPDGSPKPKSSDPYSAIRPSNMPGNATGIPANAAPPDLLPAPAPALPSPKEIPQQTLAPTLPAPTLPAPTLPAPTLPAPTLPAPTMNKTTPTILTPPVVPPAPPAPPAPEQFSEQLPSSFGSLDEIASSQQGKLSQMPKNGVPEVYEVQPGDTLWNIADQLFDDPYLWSGIWNMNKNQLSNPDILTPGTKISLTSVALGQDVGLGEKRGKSLGQEMAQGVGVAIKDTGELQVPASLASALGLRFNSVAESWKGKENQFLEISEIPKEENISFVENVPPSESTLFTIPGFMTTGQPSRVGEIINTKSSMTLANKGTHAYGKLSTSAAPGTLFLAVRQLESPSNPNGEFQTMPLYVYSGVIGLKKVHQSGIAEFYVESSDFGVMEGDFILPHRKIAVQESLNAKSTISAGIQTEVIGVLNEEYKTASMGQMVFLKQTGGLKKGMELEIYMPPNGIAIFDEPELDTKPVARVRVVEESDEAVIALILNQKAEIAVGAKTDSSPQK
jgi:LysM domain